MGRLLFRVKATVSGTPGTGAFTPSTAVSTFRSWSAGGGVSGCTYSYVAEEGTDWESGEGVWNGTTLTRPGPGVDPTFKSSTGSLISFTSAAVVSSAANEVDIMAATPPLASAFTLASGDATNLTLTNGNRGLLVGCGAQVAGNIVRWGYKALSDKTLAWKATAVVDMLNSSVSDAWMIPLCLQDSVSGRFSGHINNSPNDFYSYGWSSLTVGTPSNHNGPYAARSIYPRIFEIEHTGGNLVFRFGVDPDLMTDLTTMSATAWLTNRADRVGFGVQYGRSTGFRASMRVSSFAITGPGA
jgi:hypothetical protein